MLLFIVCYAHGTNCGGTKFGHGDTDCSVVLRLGMVLLVWYWLHLYSERVCLYQVGRQAGDVKRHRGRT